MCASERMMLPWLQLIVGVSSVISFDLQECMAWQKH